jgi:hypothetical protein
VSVISFFTAADESAARQTSELGDRLEMPCAIVHPAAKPAVARALGIDANALEQILEGTTGFLPEIGLVDRDAALDRGIEFGECTCVDGIAAHVPDLVLRHVPIERELAIAVRDGAPFTTPIEDADGIQVEIVYLKLNHLAQQLHRLLELRAPEIILLDVRARVQRAFEQLVAARTGTSKPLAWETYDKLMPGPPSSPLCEAPLGLFADTLADDVTEPRDCFVVPNGFLILYAYASVVLGPEGEVRDVFPTCGLRPVGSDGKRILFVSGGGPAARSGYFTPTPIVRDIEKREWVIGALPEGLPKFVAGTIGDVKWAIVADLEQARGYRIAPDWLGDQCGCTTTSLDGRYAYDSGWFVVEAATGKRVLDMRRFEHAVLSFTRRGDGAWRFVAEEGLVVDETGKPIVKALHPVCALDAPGNRLLAVTTDELVLTDIESGEARARFDLRPLAPGLALPSDSDLWRALLATFGIAANITGTAKSVRAAMDAGLVMYDAITDKALARAIATARKRPNLPERL